MTEPLPSRRTVEHWLSECNGWLVLLVDEFGHSPPYRWAWSGLDGIRSQGWDNGRGANPSIIVRLEDGSVETVACTTVEIAALTDELARVTAAGYAIQRAMNQLELAHRLLTPPVHRNGDTSRGRGWTPAAEREVIAAKQRARTARGNGYGDA